MNRFDRFVATLRDLDVPVNIYLGAEDRRVPGSFDPRAIAVHDSVTGSMSDDRAAQYCRDGRSDLPGPLYETLLGQDGRLRVVAWGRTNNSGRTNRARSDMAVQGRMPHDRELGVPPADDFGNSNNLNRGFAFITSGAGPYSDAQRTNGPKVIAAYVHSHGWSADSGIGSVIGHGELTRRKRDPDLDMGWLRRAAREIYLQIRGVPAPPVQVPPPNPPPRQHPLIIPWPAWMPQGHYFGDINGPARSHGGYYRNEQDEVRLIQQWFIYHGCVPGITNIYSGWADGRWEAPTTEACKRWFARFRPGQPYPTQIWRDDWVVLFRP